MSNIEIIAQEIAELENRQIDYSTAEKLAWLYIVRDHLIPKAEPAVYGDSEFMQAIQGKDIASVMALIDELMAILQAVQPQLYSGVMRKLSEL